MAGGARGLVVAGCTSSAGKTTLVTGLLRALTRRGVPVQPFKAGPDYIDPSYHGRAAGRASRNLDTWMLAPATVIELFLRACAGAQVAIVEGVMGLFDGHGPSDDAGSTAELARLLGLPVVLVVDARGAARSLAATVLGFRAFDPALELAGVVFNRVGSPAHYHLCRRAVEEKTGLPAFGYLPDRRDLVLPERHLGLVPMAEGTVPEAYLERLAAQVEATVEVESLLRRAAPPRAAGPEAGLFPGRPRPPEVRLGVARDRAFSFYYPDSLDLLEAWGAELAPFSPLADAGLPAGLDGVYIGGGFPEVYAGELAGNRSLLADLRQAAREGLPVYAECGGLMLLGRALRSGDGTEHPMAGVLPFTTRLDGTALTLGYRTVRALADGPLLARGEEARGHEFHLSRIDGAPGREAAPAWPGAAIAPAYHLLELDRPEGWRTGNVTASYVHLHLAARPGMARRFVRFCTGRKSGDKGERR